MTAQLKQMGGEEFVRKILSGERDFSGIKLEEGFDLSGHAGFAELQAYLGRQYLGSNPVNISGSYLRGVKARGLYLPFVSGWQADLRQANLEHADLRQADLRQADLRQANLEHADLRQANLWYAELMYADLRQADLWQADLGQADLRHARNLEESFNLGFASFMETVVTQTERDIIERALQNRKLFVVKE